MRQLLPTLAAAFVEPEELGEATTPVVLEVDVRVFVGEPRFAALPVGPWRGAVDWPSI